MSSKNNPLINPKTGKPIVSNVRRKVIEKDYNWGLYVYKKAFFIKKYFFLLFNLDFPFKF